MEKKKSAVEREKETLIRLIMSKFETVPFILRALVALFAREEKSAKNSCFQFCSVYVTCNK